MEFPREGLKRPRVIITKGKLYTASESKDSAEDRIDLHEPTRTRKAKRIARQRIRQGTASPGIAEGSEDCSIISGEEHGDADIFATTSFNLEHANSAGKERVTQNRNPATSSNSGLRVNKSGDNALVQHERTHVSPGAARQKKSLTSAVCVERPSVYDLTWWHILGHTLEISLIGAVCVEKPSVTDLAWWYIQLQGHTLERSLTSAACVERPSVTDLTSWHIKGHTLERSLSDAVFVERPSVEGLTWWGIPGRTLERSLTSAVCVERPSVNDLAWWHIPGHTLERSLIGAVCVESPSVTDLIWWHIPGRTLERSLTSAVCVERLSV